MVNDIWQTIYRLYKSISRFQTATPRIEDSMFSCSFYIDRWWNKKN